MQQLHVTFGKSRKLCDAATDVYHLQYAPREKYGLAAIEGVFFLEN